MHGGACDMANAIRNYVNQGLINMLRSLHLIHHNCPWIYVSYVIQSCYESVFSQMFLYQLFEMYAVHSYCIKAIGM